jgi:cell division FtsZ-interacting protein ZapD
MKSISNSFEHMMNHDNIKRTIIEALKHKKKTKALYDFYSHGIDKQASRINILLKLNLLPEIDTRKNKYKIINESTNKKQRERYVRHL